VKEILQGLRLIEVADWGFVPSAATVLGDWGADIIKIEHPVRGDPMRGLITSGIIPGARGVNFFIEHLSRNKRSVGIDFTKPAGRDLIYRLVETADVFLTSFLPSARARLGITYEDLKKINIPVLVMHGDDDQIVPYADSGPLSAKLLKNGTLKTYKGFPHGMPTTEAATINADLVAFIKG